ncbi:aspartate--ammonia ligase [Haploplasma axanthum]|uniref:Aspartate--ammonia ligase n=1 Tax=Haploplasma axanthum TaxID=29552 RepID=A0A449BFV9_HAPAX|nr:aspartate--ammonia ligase [Haploplasma axanthum]VEU81295.1 Aspartate--ammonia ligase [Haploplasma axanthum]
MYKSKLTMKETQKAIKIVKDNFEKELSKKLNLDRVSAPIIVESNKGINDDLGIKNSALNFHIKTLGYNVEIVQSLAKWKRMALKKYGYNLYEGIYTDMNAIRPLDITDKTHSIYVDQWDWELVIDRKDRNEDFLEEIVKKIVKALKETKDLVRKSYQELKDEIKEEVFFIDASDLYDLYPNSNDKERERLITKEHKTVFIKKIGKKFENGMIHDLRAADYDDWNLNGDILIWSEILDDAIEISSMGIRVDKDSLLEQLEEVNREEDINTLYHKMILNEELPLTIGGGIGQSRLCMLLLEKTHIAEVQASIWNDDEMEYFAKNKIDYL